jgi:hypothetical protein
VAIALVAVALMGTASASAKFSGVEGHWLAFERLSGASADIFVARPHGPGVNITQSPAMDEHPAWDVPPVDADCSHPSQLPQHHRLAFDSRAPGGNADVFVVEVAGLEAMPPAPAPVGAPVNITNSPAANDTAPAWRTERFLPSGGGPALGLLAFTSDRDTNQDGQPDRDIFVADENGGHLVNVTQNDADDANPEWSPDGTHIAFESTRSGTRQIWAVSISIVDGTAVAGMPYQVTHGDEPKHDPTWLGHSPLFGEDPPGPVDDELVYSVEQGGRSYLDATVQDIADGLADPFGPLAGPPPTVQELTGDPGDDSAPAWSAGAWAVVFATTGGGTSHSLSILRGSSSDPLTVQSGPVVAPSGDDTNPDWQPFYNCAEPHPQMPAPAPVTRTPKSPAGGSGGGDSAGGGAGGGSGSGSGNSGGTGNPRTDAISVRATRVRVIRRGGRRVVVVTLVVSRAARGDVRLTRAGRVVARRRFRLHRGTNRLLLAIGRKPRSGTYRLTLAVRSAGTTRTIVRALRVRR